MTGSAIVVRCHACNVQTTIINGAAPERCETCGRRVEQRPPAQVVEEAA